MWSTCFSFHLLLCFSSIFILFLFSKLFIIDNSPPLVSSGGQPHGVIFRQTWNVKYFKHLYFIIKTIIWNWKILLSLLTYYHYYCKFFTYFLCDLTYMIIFYFCTFAPSLFPLVISLILVFYYLFIFYYLLLGTIDVFT